jgi:hypothetical protein
MEKKQHKPSLLSTIAFVIDFDNPEVRGIYYCLSNKENTGFRLPEADIDKVQQYYSALFRISLITLYCLKYPTPEPFIPKVPYRPGSLFQIKNNDADYGYLVKPIANIWRSSHSKIKPYFKYIHPDFKTELQNLFAIITAESSDDYRLEVSSGIKVNLFYFWKPEQVPYELSNASTEAKGFSLVSVEFPQQNIELTELFRFAQRLNPKFDLPLFPEMNHLNNGSTHSAIRTRNLLYPGHTFEEKKISDMNLSEIWTTFSQGNVNLAWYPQLQQLIFCNKLDNNTLKMIVQRLESDATILENTGPYSTKYDCHSLAAQCYHHLKDYENECLQLLHAWTSARPIDYGWGINDAVRKIKGLYENPGIGPKLRGYTLRLLSATCLDYNYSIKHLELLDRAKKWLDHYFFEHGHPLCQNK